MTTSDILALLHLLFVVIFGVAELIIDLTKKK